MTGLMRRLKGALGMSVTWGIGGALLGGAVQFLTAIGGAISAPWIPLLGLTGAISGFAFSGVLAFAGRNRSFSELSLSRFAMWGAVGGAIVAVPALVLIGVETVAGFAAVMAVSALGSSIAATGTLALARFASDPAAIPANDGLDDVGLSAAEQKKLLGE